MRRGNWKISTKRYKRDSFFQPTLAGGNFPERGRSWPPILFDPMMLQLYTLCFFFLWSIGDIFSSFETTKIKPRTERTTKIIQKKRKSGAIGKPEKQASRALRLPASSYDDIPKPAAALGFRSPASSSSSSSSPSSSRSWSCCGYYYALFTEWATFRFSLAFFLAQASQSAQSAVRPQKHPRKPTQMCTAIRSQAHSHILGPQVHFQLKSQVNRVPLHLTSFDRF